jgi:hypothetical protein
MEPPGYAGNRRNTAHAGTHWSCRAALPAGEVEEEANLFLLEQESRICDEGGRNLSENG